MLAIATFASVRSANRSARVAEVALEEQRRPVLVQSRHGDPHQKIFFLGGHFAQVQGSRGTAEDVDGTVYLAISLRNVGSGIGVLQGWTVRVGLQRPSVDHSPEHEFRPQTIDLYIPAGDIGLWQGALRDPGGEAEAIIQADRQYRREQSGIVGPELAQESVETIAEVRKALANRDILSIELLYSDQVGGQRAITRFNLNPVGDDVWLAVATRHWHLDEETRR